MALQLHKCTCCGSDVTAPQYYNGKVYGYTCITKVAPTQKRTRKQSRVVESFNINTINSNTSRCQPIITVDSKKFKINLGYLPVINGSLDLKNGQGKEWLLVDGVLSITGETLKQVEKSL